MKILFFLSLTIVCGGSYNSSAGGGALLFLYSFCWVVGGVTLCTWLDLFLSFAL